MSKDKRKAVKQATADTEQCSSYTHVCEIKWNFKKQKRPPGKAASEKWMIGFGMFLPLTTISDME